MKNRREKVLLGQDDPHNNRLSGSSRSSTKLIRLSWHSTNQPHGPNSTSIRHNASAQPPGAWLTTIFSPLILCVFRLISTGLHGQAAVKRTHANNIKLRLNTGATGHDEGNESFIRSCNSWTRAPSLRKRIWIVSIVAEAHWVVLQTSRRKVSSNT